MIPVDAIEYVNVRIRGFHSRLLPRDIYENFLEVDNLSADVKFLRSISKRNIFLRIDTSLSPPWRRFRI